MLGIVSLINVKNFKLIFHNNRACCVIYPQLKNSYVFSISCSLGAASSHSFRDLAPSISLFLYIMSCLRAHFYPHRHETTEVSSVSHPFSCLFIFLLPSPCSPFGRSGHSSCWLLPHELSPLQPPLLLSECWRFLHWFQDHGCIPPFTCTALCLAASPGKYLKECTYPSPEFSLCKVPHLITGEELPNGILMSPLRMIA